MVKRLRAESQPKRRRQRLHRMPPTNGQVDRSPERSSRRIGAGMTWHLGVEFHSMFSSFYAASLQFRSISVHFMLARHQKKAPKPLGTKVSKHGDALRRSTTTSARRPATHREIESMEMEAKRCVRWAFKAAAR